MRAAVCLAATNGTEHRLVAQRFSGRKHQPRGPRVRSVRAAARRLRARESSACGATDFASDTRTGIGRPTENAGGASRVTGNSAQVDFAIPPGIDHEGEHPEQVRDEAEGRRPPATGVPAAPVRQARRQRGTSAPSAGSSARRLDPLNQRAKCIVRRHALEFELRRNDHAVAKHRARERLDVIGNDVVPSVEQCRCLGELEQRHARPR